MEFIQSAEIPIGPNYKAARIKEVAKSVNAKDFAKLTQLHVDDDTPSTFCIVRPRLALAGLQDVDAAALFLKVVVHEKLVDMVSQGEEAVPEIKAHCRALRDMLATCPDDMSVMASAAAEEVENVCSYLLAVLDGDFTKIPDIAETMRTSKHGGRALIRHSMAQNSHWRSLEQDARKVTLANASLGPDVASMSERLAKRDADAPGEALKKLPVWLDALSKGSTSALCDQLEEVLKAECDALQEDD